MTIEPVYVLIVGDDPLLHELACRVSTLRFEVRVVSATDADHSICMRLPDLLISDQYARPGQSKQIVEAILETRPGVSCLMVPSGKPERLAKMLLHFRDQLIESKEKAQRGP